MRAACTILILALGCEITSGGSRDPNRGGAITPDNPPPDNPVIADARAGTDAMEKSLAAKRIRNFDVFTEDGEVVTVEYEGRKGARGEAERAELGYVLASAAVAFPWAAKVQAHRFVGETPRSRSRSTTVMALRVVAGEVAYPRWLASIPVEALRPADTYVLGAR